MDKEKQKQREKEKESRRKRRKRIHLSVEGEVGKVHWTSGLEKKEEG